MLVTVLRCLVFSGEFLCSHFLISLHSAFEAKFALGSLNPYEIVVMTFVSFFYTEHF